jgi:hypothetical protein
MGRQPTERAKAKPQPAAAHPSTDDRFVDPIVQQIRELWRRRQAWHRAEIALTLAASAICRRYVGVAGKGDKIGLKKAADLLAQIEAGTDHSDAAIAALPILHARDQISPHRLATERLLERLAKKLPVASIINDTAGFGALSLAAIVGEAGDVSAYRTLRGLYKRFGVGRVDGERQRKKSDPLAARAHAYSPARRSVLWNVGNGLIGYMGHGPRPRVGEDIDARTDLSSYQKLFIKRLRFEADRNPAHRKPNATRKGQVFESFSKHAANRARRYVEKMFLTELYEQWKTASADPLGVRKPEQARSVTLGACQSIRPAKAIDRSAGAPHPARADRQPKTSMRRRILSTRPLV